MKEYKEIVEELLETLPTLEERYRIIEELNECYYEDHGVSLPSELLHRLGDWILKEEYTDKTTNKASKTPYPVLSDHQFRRRSKRLVFVEDENTLAMVKFHRSNNSTVKTGK